MTPPPLQHSPQQQLSPRSPQAGVPLPLAQSPSRGPSQLSSSSSRVSLAALKSFVEGPPKEVTAEPAPASPAEAVKATSTSTATFNTLATIRQNAQQKAAAEEKKRLEQEQREAEERNKREEASKSTPTSAGPKSSPGARGSRAESARSTSPRGRSTQLSPSSARERSRSSSRQRQDEEKEPAQVTPGRETRKAPIVRQSANRLKQDSKGTVKTLRDPPASAGTTALTTASSSLLSLSPSTFSSPSPLPTVPEKSVLNIGSPLRTSSNKTIGRAMSPQQDQRAGTAQSQSRSRGGGGGGAVRAADPVHRAAFTLDPAASKAENPHQLSRHRQQPSSFPLPSPPPPAAAATDEATKKEEEEEAPTDRVRVHSSAQLKHFQQSSASSPSLHGGSSGSLLRQPIKRAGLETMSAEDDDDQRRQQLPAQDSPGALANLPRKPLKLAEPALAMRKRGGGVAGPIPISARGGLGQHSTTSPPSGKPSPKATAGAAAAPGSGERQAAASTSSFPKQRTPVEKTPPVRYEGQGGLQQDDQPQYSEREREREVTTREESFDFLPPSAGLAFQSMLSPAAAAVEPLQPLNSSFSSISSSFSPGTIKASNGTGGAGGHLNLESRGPLRKAAAGGGALREVIARERRGAAVAAPAIQTEEDVILLAEVQAKARALQEKQKEQQRKQLLEFQRAQKHAHIGPKVPTQQPRDDDDGDADLPIVTSYAKAAARRRTTGAVPVKKKKKARHLDEEPEPIDPQELLADLHEKAATAGPTRIPAPVFRSGVPRPTVGPAAAQPPQEEMMTQPLQHTQQHDAAGPLGFYALQLAMQQQQQQQQPQLSEGQHQHTHQQQGRAIYYRPYTLKDFKQDKEGLSMGAVDPRTGLPRYQELPKGLGAAAVGSEEHRAKTAAREKAKQYAEEARLAWLAEQREKEEQRAQGLMAMASSASSPSLLFSSPLRAAGASAAAGASSLGFGSVGSVGSPLAVSTSTPNLHSGGGGAGFHNLTSPADSAAAALRELEQRHLDRELELEALALQRELVLMERQQQLAAVPAKKVPSPPPPAPASSSSGYTANGGGYANGHAGHPSSSASLSPRRLVDAAEERRKASQASKTAELAALRKKAREFARAVPPAATGKNNLHWNYAPPDSKYTAYFSEKVEEDDENEGEEEDEDEDEDGGDDTDGAGGSEDGEGDYDSGGENEEGSAAYGLLRNGHGAYKRGRGTGLDDGDNIPTLAITKGALKAAAAEAAFAAGAAGPSTGFVKPPRAALSPASSNSAAVLLQEHLKDDRRRRGSSSSSTQGPATLTGSKNGGGGGGSTARRSQHPPGTPPSGSAPAWIKKITKQRRKRERSHASAASKSPKSAAALSPSGGTVAFAVGGGRPDPKGLAAALHASPAVAGGQLYPLSDAELADLLQLATAAPGDYIAAKQEKLAEEQREKEERKRLRKEKKEKKNKPDFSPVRAGGDEDDQDDVTGGSSQARYYNSAAFLQQQGPPLHMTGSVPSRSPSHLQQQQKFSPASILPLSTSPSAVRFSSASVPVEPMNITARYGNGGSSSSLSGASASSKESAWWMAGPVHAQVEAMRTVRKATSPSQVGGGGGGMAAGVSATSPHSSFGTGPMTVLPSTLPSSKRSPVAGATSGGKGKGGEDGFPISVQVPGLRGLDALQSQQAKQVEAIKKSLAGSLKV